MALSSSVISIFYVINISYVIRISYVISNLVISRSVLNV